MLGTWRTKRVGVGDPAGNEFEDEAIVSLSVAEFDLGSNRVPVSFHCQIQEYTQQPPEGNSTHS
jgi:hypothetical protein